MRKLVVKQLGTYNLLLLRMQLCWWQDMTNTHQHGADTLLKSRVGATLETFDLAQCSTDVLWCMAQRNLLA